MDHAYTETHASMQYTEGMKLGADMDVMDDEIVGADMYDHCGNGGRGSAEPGRNGRGQNRANSHMYMCYEHLWIFTLFKPSH
jgi:hypothetical protein